MVTKQHTLSHSVIWVEQRSQTSSRNKDHLTFFPYQFSAYYNEKYFFFLKLKRAHLIAHSAIFSTLIVWFYFSHINNNLLCLYICTLNWCSFTWKIIYCYDATNESKTQWKSVSHLKKKVLFYVKQTIVATDRYIFRRRIFKRGKHLYNTQNIMAMNTKNWYFTHLFPLHEQNI